MSITSPIPVLQGDRGTELRADGEDLVLRRPDDELRIPLAAIARVRTERRDVAVELTAPTGAEPVVYRIEGVSAAGAAVFADVVNTALPERVEGEATIDGSTLVVTRSLRSADEWGDEEDEDDARSGLVGRDKGVFYTLAVVVTVLAVAVGVVDGSWSRGIATLLLGQAAAGATYLFWVGVAVMWEDWYLPRYGITVDAKQVYRHGTTTLAYTDTDGLTHHVRGVKQNGTVRVAYHPRKPKNAVPCKTLRDRSGDLAVFLTMAVIAALLAYVTYLLALPAFGG